jgi:hypothetical protein
LRFVTKRKGAHFKRHPMKKEAPCKTQRGLF